LTYTREVGERLRRVRLDRGLSLQDVERTSKGRWKAAVVGSYERGDRNITATRLLELAEFYGVTPGDVLPGESPVRQPEEATGIVLDLQRLEELGDRWGIAAARTARATQALGRGDLTTLRHDGEQGWSLFRELGDRWGEMHAAQALSTHAEISGDYERATRLIHDGMRIAVDLGFDSYVSHHLAKLGRIALLHGDHAQAQQLHERARWLAVQNDDKPGEHYAALGLALGAFLLRAARGRV
jgi:transcriptional regulator with XRE-family HTH domain